MPTAPTRMRTCSKRSQRKDIRNSLLRKIVKWCPSCIIFNETKNGNFISLIHSTKLGKTHNKMSIFFSGWTTFFLLWKKVFFFKLVRPLKKQYYFFCVSSFRWWIFLFWFVQFPEVCKTEEVCRRTLATMFAHFEQETAGLYYVREINRVRRLYRPSLEYCLDQLTLYTLSIFPSVHKPLILTIFEAHIVVQPVP